MDHSSFPETRTFLMEGGLLKSKDFPGLLLLVGVVLILNLLIIK